MNDSGKFHSREEVPLPNWPRLIARMVAGLVLLSIMILVLVPWVQTSQGDGTIIAFDPDGRVQDISSPVPGRINKWYVRDGSRVKKGDVLVEIIDNDPNFIERLKIERDAILRKYEAAKAASETALLNFERQKDLFNQGLSARTKLEKAKIEYKKLLAAEATSAANLAKAEVRFSRQQTQLVSAPRDGTVLRVLHASGTVVVQEGDVLASFVPHDIRPAVEIYVSGNDLPLIYPGRKVRLQFEGWPAVQFSGWPSVAVGTFGGVVSIIDPSASYAGKFRIIVVPDAMDGPWPDLRYLRQGTRVYGWVLLNTVKLGYELWRQINGFPATLDNAPDGSKNREEKLNYFYKPKKKGDKSKDYKDPYGKK